MAQNVDGKQYYGYLFEADKKPTKVLDALLRGIAIYISTSIGNTEQKKLTPDKLATFYKAVGGNYDSLFVEVPPPSISWIYASIGCQHTLQPTSDDFAPPSIPALTKKGFVRWQSIEILLGPEEHVPFIQTAVRTFNIKHPDTGEPFPLDLPASAFPLVADKEIEKWHNACAEKLRQRATPTDEDIRPHLPPRPKVQSGYTHVRPLRRAETDNPYFDSHSSKSRPSRPISYQHVSSGRPVRPKLSRSPSHTARQFLAPEDSGSPRLARSRRRSVPENLGSSPTSPSSQQGAGADLKPPQEPHVRRHSHPRQARRGSHSSDASSSSDGESPPSPNTRSRRRSQADRPSVRYSTVPPSPSVNAVPPLLDPRLRPRVRDFNSKEEELKRRSFPIPIDLTGKLSAPFLLGKRAAPRDTSRNGNVRWKDLDGADLFRRSEDDGGPEVRRRGSGEPRSDREGYKRRERERDREGAGYRERPRLHARRSSHEDLRRERERDRDREERGTASGEGRSFRERERDRERRVASGEVRGVDGRRHPAH
ncbi:hypothetical protein V8E51_016810 [Hyaloscypha variabilis]